MIKIINTGSTGELEKFVGSFKNRAASTPEKIERAVAGIISNVRERGDEAVAEYSLRFDGWSPEKPELTAEDMRELSKDCDPDFIEALKRASENIYAFHQRQKQQSRIDAGPDGIITGQRVRPLHRVGVYVPGGTAGYPSSVLMNVIPAKVAGVGEIIMATPPGRAGRPDPNIMAAALLAGVDRVFLMGGAQAVAAMAYGTASVPKVDKIVGPGNIYVATAKKQLFGTVDIDMIAGPSEVLIIAGSGATPAYLAADLMSQAEHDPMASAVLLTVSDAMALAVQEQLSTQMRELSRRDIIESSLDNYGAIIVCRSMDEAVSLANELAPEHLEVCAENPFEYIGRLDNAGSVFLGEYSPEPLGDYYAGANHVLPTGGTARFFSPLSVDDFIKKSSYIYYPKDQLLRAAPDIIKLAETEELTAHANSVWQRVKLEGDLAERDG